MAGNSKSGRKRLPTHLKLVEGKHYRMNERKNEPIATGELGDPPGHFNDEQREVWIYALKHS